MLRADLQAADLVLVKGCDFAALAKAGVAPDAVCTAEVLSSTAVGARCKVAGVSDMLLLPPGHQAASRCVRPERVRRFVFVGSTTNKTSAENRLVRALELKQAHK